MEESKRQKQVAKLIQQEMSAIFQKEGMSMVKGGMVSLSKVQVTPDLLEARIYLSFFQIDQPQQLLHEIKERTKEWRKLLGLRAKDQLRRIPELVFFTDDTLEHVFKMESLFQQIEEERRRIEASKPGAEPDAS